MKDQNQTSQSKPLTDPDKKFYLKEIEKTNIESRQDLIKQYQYLIHVINMDTQAYLQYEVLKRLAIGPGKNYILSPDNSFITLPGGEHDSDTKK